MYYFTTLIPTTAQNFHTKVYTNTESFLLISASSAIFGETFDKEKQHLPVLCFSLLNIYLKMAKMG